MVSDYRVKDKKILEELLQKTYRLRGTTQHCICCPSLVPCTAHAKPGLCIIDSSGHPLELAETRGWKVRLWIAGTMVSMETDGLDVVR